MITTIFTDLPLTIKGFVKRTFDDGEYYYTIVLNAQYNKEQQEEAYLHEMRHIMNNDFDKENVEEIECQYNS